MDKNKEDNQMEVFEDIDNIEIIDSSNDIVAKDKENIIKKHKKKLNILIATMVILITILIIRVIYANTIPNFEEITSNTESGSSAQGNSVQKYFPFKANTLYEYTQADGSSQNRMMFVDYYDSTKVQYLVYQPAISDKWFSEVYEFDNGEIKKVLSNAMFDQNVNLLNYDYREESTILLKEPVVVGNEWNINNTDATASITDLDVNISTPNGLYKSIEVSIDNKNGSYEKMYFSEAVGLVKYISTDIDGMETELVLSGVEPLSKGLSSAMYVYYLDADTYYGRPTLVEYNIVTNEEKEDTLQSILSTSPSENLKPLISPYTDINFIKIDKDLNYVQVDFSKEFLDYTSKNKSTETKHLMAIADTFCRYYQVLNCKITIDGQSYTTENYQFGPDDTIKAQF